MTSLCLGSIASSHCFHWPGQTVPTFLKLWNSSVTLPSHRTMSPSTLSAQSGHQAHTTPTCLTPSPSLYPLASEDKASLILFKVHQPLCTWSHSFQALLSLEPAIYLLLTSYWSLPLPETYEQAYVFPRLKKKKKKKRSFLSQSSLTTHFSPTTALCLLFPYQSSLSFAPTTGPDIQQAAHKYLVHG